MSKRNTITLIGPSILLVGLVLSYMVVIRPWHMRWGATDREVAMILPGDAIAAPGAATSTRAITIRAPASTVWAWLIQTGQNRGGDWYSYEWLENLFAAGMRPVTAIDPRLQELNVGDEWYMHAAAPANPLMAVTVEGLEKERALWLRGGWTFALFPVDANTTRLIVRYPMRPAEFFHPALSYAIFEPAHFVMESGMMLGLKQYAERDPYLRNQSLSPVKGGDPNATR
jgi:hypothetical protein